MTATLMALAMMVARPFLLSATQSSGFRMFLSESFGVLVRQPWENATSWRWYAEHDVLTVTHLSLAGHAQVVVEALGALVPETNDGLITAVTDDTTVRLLGDTERVGEGRWRGLCFLDTDSLRSSVDGSNNRGRGVPIDTIDLNTDDILKELLGLQEYSKIVAVDDAEFSSGLVCREG